MRHWQAKAIAAIDRAALKMKKKILDDKNAKASFRGEISGGINIETDGENYGKPVKCQVSYRQFEPI